MDVLIYKKKTEGRKFRGSPFKHSEYGRTWIQIQSNFPDRIRQKIRNSQDPLWSRNKCMQVQLRIEFRCGSGADPTAKLDKMLKRTDKISAIVEIYLC
jgi:hypothetical protein